MRSFLVGGDDQKAAQFVSAMADAFSVGFVRTILMLGLGCCLFAGCGEKSLRMEHPEDPKGRYREQIEAASRLLDQKVDWAHRTEWEVNPLSEGWELTAWRIHYPDRKGPNRYLPWGYATIRLDSRMTPIYYKKKG